MARQRAEPFTTTLRSGQLDQRKVGSQRAVNLQYITKGAAGDYEVIHDLSTGRRAAMSRKLFEVWFTLDAE